MCLFIHIILMYTHILTIKRNYVNNETYISPFLINYDNLDTQKKYDGSLNTQNQDKKFFNFFVPIYKNENEDSIKYCIKAKS